MGRFGLLLILAMLARADCRAWADDRSGLRYAVEATYLYKFVPFVTWPQTAGQGPMRLCVAGEDRVTQLIPHALQGQSADGQPIAIQHLDAQTPPDGCTILYNAASAGPAELLAARGKPILTVAEGGDAPAIISLVVIAGHVRFDIDEALAEEAKLTISSKLLSLAHAVRKPAGVPR